MKELFETPWKEKIQEKLPKLFRIAEIESSRAGKIGMEVGSVREKILISLLICIFGQQSVDTNIPITKSEIDVIVKGKPISVKTVTGNGDVKACWTVDQESASRFAHNYHPEGDILFVRIFWNEAKPSFFYIPIEVQKQIQNNMGINNYLNLPRLGTNPRGVSFSRRAIKSLENHPNTAKMIINWKHQDVEVNIYQRWMDYWLE